MNSNCAVLTRWMNRSIAIVLLGAASACMAPVADDGEQPQDDEQQIGLSKAALNAGCTNLGAYPRIAATNATGTPAENVRGSIQFGGYCFNGGNPILVWATDYVTKQMVFDYTWVTAWPDEFAGMVLGTLPGTCTPAKWVQLHAVDYNGNLRTDSTLYHLTCP